MLNWFIACIVLNRLSVEVRVVKRPERWKGRAGGLRRCEITSNFVMGSCYYSLYFWAVVGGFGSVHDLIKGISAPRTSAESSDKKSSHP